MYTCLGSTHKTLRIDYSEGKTDHVTFCAVTLLECPEISWWPAVILHSESVCHSLDYVCFSHTIIAITSKACKECWQWQYTGNATFRVHLGSRHSQGSSPRLTSLFVWFHWHYWPTLVSTLYVQTCCARWESVLEDIDTDYEQGVYIHRHTWNKLAHISLHSKLLLGSIISLQHSYIWVGVLPGARMQVNTHLVSCSTGNNIHRSPREFEAICHL